MKAEKNLLVLLGTLFILFALSGNVVAQNYNNIINVSNNTFDLSYGAKIKTNLLFQHQNHMMYLKIEGYDYLKNKTLNLSLIWFTYDNTFYQPQVSSAGSSTPDVWLANENGKVVIYLDEKVAYQRFSVSAFCINNNATDSNFEGWTATYDEPLGGSNRTLVPYMNNFKGKVGINTENPAYELDVNGTIRAKEIRVETGWADFVFKDDYKLPTLNEVKAHIDEHKHLPGIPSEAEVKENGVGLSEISTKLLQKVEELTLYMIQQNEQMEKQNEQIEKQNKEIENLKQQLKSKN